MFGKKELKELDEKTDYINKKITDLEEKHFKLLQALGFAEEQYVEQRTHKAIEGGKTKTYTYYTGNIRTRLVKKETSTEKKETSTGKAPKENEKRTKKERLAYSRGFHAGRRSKTSR